MADVIRAGSLSGKTFRSVEAFGLMLGPEWRCEYDSDLALITVRHIRGAYSLISDGLLASENTEIWAPLAQALSDAARHHRGQLYGRFFRDGENLGIEVVPISE